MILYFYTAIAGFFGAILRVFVSGLVNSKFHVLFPMGTFLVNISGSFLMCLFMTFTLEVVQIRKEYRTAIATGLLGAYTTFSLFSLETYKLISSGNFWIAGVYFFSTPVSCVVFGYLGLLLAKQLFHKYKVQSREKNTN